MPVPFVNVSLLTSGASAEGGARNFSYLRVLNTDVLGGGGGATTVGSTITSFVSSMVTSLISQNVTNYTFQNSNNVSFGTNGSYVTATAGPQARSAAWAVMGVYVASASPTNPCVYSDWLSGSNGYFGWLQLP